MERPSGDINRLAGRFNSHYSGYGHIEYLTGDYRAVAQVANFIAYAADIADGAARSASASLAAALEIVGGLHGIGARPLDLPRNTELGRTAFSGHPFTFTLYPRVVSSVTLTPDDAGKAILANGDVTLPESTAPGMDTGWVVLIKNRHTSNSITVQTSGDDTVDGLTSETIAPLAGMLLVQTGPGTFSVLL